MKVIKEIQDWYKANILGDQSLQKAREQRLFERRIDDAINHVVLSDKPNDNGIPYPVVCINGTVVYKVCSNPRLEKGEIGLENVGEVLTRLRKHYAENRLNYR